MVILMGIPDKTSPSTGRKERYVQISQTRMAVCRRPINWMCAVAYPIVNPTHQMG
jgi:hypothetical protein